MNEIQKKNKLKIEILLLKSIKNKDQTVRHLRHAAKAMLDGGFPKAEETFLFDCKNLFICETQASKQGN